jgi:hypothetical protein
MKRWLVCILSIFAATMATAQNYPQGYFRSPLDTPLFLSANFGAIRGNHFHSGIDIKTFGQEGLPVKAVADGYVVRIKVSPFGYGRALYINHPNGYTTVYGHLQHFDDLLDSVVREEQYRRKSFDIEIFPPANKYKVVKGQLIAISGNSGGSTGPHLHFEIRDTRTEETIDPLLFGLPIEDIYAPKLSNSFLVYEMDDIFKHRNGHYPFVEVKRRVVSNAWGDTVKVTPGVYSFAAWGEDFINEANDGVHLNYLQLFEGDKKIYDCGINRFAFDDTRMVNDHIEYYEYKTHSQRWHKCYVDDGNSLGFYKPHKKQGIAVQEGEVKPVTIKTFDLAGHADSISFLLMGDSNQPHFMAFHSKPKTTDFAYPSKLYVHTGTAYGFTIPKWALYDTIAVTTQLTSAGKRKNLYAGYISVLNPDIPLQKSFTISIKPTNIKGLDTDKLLIVRLSGKGLKYMSSEGGKYADGWVTASTKTFGIFSIAYDNVKPVVSRFKHHGDEVSVHITDALSGIDSYNAYLDGEWLLMEYDAKSDMLNGILPKDLPAGKHELKFVVTDSKNNTNTLIQTIEK